jgi:hypothetical protein
MIYGHKVARYDVPVINEREARAAAGILLVLGLVSFLNAFLTHDFTFTKIFVTLFMVDFAIRVILSPDFSPSMILGRFFVRNQKPEYVGASQKRFAWSIGLVLAVVMFVIMIILELMTPVKIVICLLCLIFLFAESALGICMGCKIFNWLNRENKYCPGGVCEIVKRENITKISTIQAIIAVVSISIFAYMVYSNKATNEISKVPATMKCETGKCGAGM